MPSRRSFLSILAAASAFQSIAARAQELFSPFVGSDPENVERMVRIAAPADGETVIDLGSGDGRIVFAALRDRPGVRGIGVDINADLVAKAKAAAGDLADRAQFLHQNVFDADLGKVDVIFMWLFPELMRLLRPKILSQARPGTRIVAATWGMGTWPADATDERTGNYTTIRLWHVPARVEGAWEWEADIGGITHRFEALLEQHFQQAEGAVRVGHRRQLLQGVELRGTSLQCLLNMTLPGTGHTRLSFSGQVRGDVIEGTMDVHLPLREDGETEAESIERIRLPWKARRAATVGYFAPTGTNLS
ncbi:MAG: methyltransferase domain-containing protein [Burkholderiales bacterium]|nr:methyltransferase domain-containing protein [Burkholderiales bacterium]